MENKPKSISAARKPAKSRGGDPEKIGEKYGRRPSVEIAKDYVELNLKTVIDAEKIEQMSAKERRNYEKTQKKLARKAGAKIPRGVKVFLSVIILLAFAIGSGVVWWQTSTAPVSAKTVASYQFTVANGATSDQIGEALQKAGIIRNSLAFSVYARIHPKIIKAGNYQVSPSWNMQKIFDVLSQTAAAQTSIMIPPGATLEQIKDVFAKAGYTTTEVNAAISKDYDDSILSDKPEDATLEGYLFPDTYQIAEGADLSTVVESALKEMNDFATKNNLREKFADKGLTFYQGLTLASIIVREAPDGDDQPIIAGVFYNRLKADMLLQSDTTYEYAYNQGLCTTKDTTCDSEYNTYQHDGLPPGPIANASKSALLAAADPTTSGYFYFFADADGKVHYETTLEQQQSDIATYGLSQ